ncbi:MULTISPECIES: hypothetical protein [unclassified Bradyrhizobium]|uniref:hypothetical protein n=1 Tax=unclassified Bradyrhizobium TaxID=2631580 RepID=UPI001FDF1159|nr:MULTISPECIES: hypothetical protein [unclassified Bradyrhizobium]MDI4232107.1 hypothetical protein [Bradyrhizobium sp. Arg237L]
MAGVKQDRDGAVGILILNEPESLNAMTPDLVCTENLTRVDDAMESLKLAE